ncbi:hypothetical protein I550_1168 [Mycobacterium intracellulare 1956]|uniref:Uncharacterized protein n=1 Tax=Mycobacterium intracellulare 1956 TaxID=1299331 RepID=X8CQA3_MYCIT|nr:hypothetical protein I550_1168 [Mycobacterium intracellulare 1956]
MYGVAGVLIVLSSFWGWRGPYGTHPINGFVIAMCLAIAAAYAARAARFKPRRQRYGWLALVTALLGWAAGEVIWAFYDVRPEFDHATHPAATEFVLLLWPVGAMTSLVLLSQLSRKSPGVCCSTVSSWRRRCSSSPGCSWSKRSCRSIPARGW